MLLDDVVEAVLNKRADIVHSFYKPHEPDLVVYMNIEFFSKCRAETIKAMNSSLLVVTHGSNFVNDNQIAGYPLYVASAAGDLEHPDYMIYEFGGVE